MSSASVWSGVGCGTVCMIPGGCSDDRYFHWYSDNRRLGPAAGRRVTLAIRYQAAWTWGWRNHQGLFRPLYLSLYIAGQMDSNGLSTEDVPLSDPKHSIPGDCSIVRVSRWRLYQPTLEPVPALWWSYGRNVLVTAWWWWRPRPQIVCRH